MEAGVSPSTLLGLAFGLGVLFGAVGNRTHFCTMGAVADIVNIGDWSRMRMWLLAIAVAILGSSLLHTTGTIDLGKSIYRGNSLPWLASILGGACFGVGMVLASGCAGKTLIRLGGGNLKSLVVFIVIGLSAYMTLRGILAGVRVEVLDRGSIALAAGQDIPALVAAATQLDLRSTQTIVAFRLAGALLAFIFARRDFLSFDNLLGGIVTGGLVVGGWCLSGHLGYLAEDPETLSEVFLTTNSGRMESLSFVAPLAYTLDLLMLWTDSTRKPSFGIALALGVAAGSLVYAVVTRSFRWEGFANAADTTRHLLGASLMGFGGVLAAGCTIGQGISGISTLALSAFLTFGAIVAGAALMLKYQYWQMLREA